MGKYIKLSPKEKSEYRRLVQNYNRRVKRAFDAYEKIGAIVPRELTGGIQVKEQWFSDKYAMSRGVKLTVEEYKKNLKFLKDFEPTKKGKKKRPNAVPTVTEYKKILHKKTKKAVETVLGVDAPESIKKKMSKMSAPELSAFWQRFATIARKKGVKYSSNEAMNMVLNEFFSEDMEHFNKALKDQEDELTIRQNFIRDMQKFDQLKRR